MDNFARNLDWNLLYSFMIVVQEKSMTKAAIALHRTQPAVSQAIKRLEESAGVTLIERRKTGVVPTPDGVKLLEQVRSVYATISRMPVSFEQATKAVSGQIRIYAIDHVVSPKTDQQISSFFRKYSGVDLEIKISTTADIISAVELGTCTIGITDGVVPSHLHARELLTERFGLYCGKDHHLAGRKDLSVDDLRAEPFIGFTADVLGGEHMGDVTAFRAKASLGQRVRGQSSYVYEVRRMIEAGLGIGFLPVHLVEANVRAGTLWQLPPYEDMPAAPVYLLSNPAIQPTRAEQLFLRALDLPVRA